MTNGLHNLLLGASTAGEPYFANASYAQHFATSCKNTLTPASLYTNSSTSYNPLFDPGGPSGRRWGDFSTTSIDPNDNMTMWTIQEFCNDSNSWGCQVIRILAPPPPPFVISPITVPAVSSLNINLIGTGTDGSAFYDPPADFLNHLKVSIDGCIVNSVTVVNPTQLIVNISTLGCQGIKNIIVTNPDGQEALGLNTLMVCP